MRNNMAKKRKKVSKSVRKKVLEKIEYEVSSGNLFRDFGFSNPEERDAKSDLALIISSTIKHRNLTQTEAAELMRTDQSKVSKIAKGLLSEFTIERLMKYMVLLGIDVEITTKESKTVIPSIHVNKSNLKRLRAC
jgi:predicted XRE-type DNA-binding protein